MHTHLGWFPDFPALEFSPNFSMALWNGSMHAKERVGHATPPHTSAGLYPMLRYFQSVQELTRDVSNVESCLLMLASSSIYRDFYSYLPVEEMPNVLTSSTSLGRESQRSSTIV